MYACMHENYDRAGRINVKHFISCFPVLPCRKSQILFPHKSCIMERNIVQIRSTLQREDGAGAGLRARVPGDCDAGQVGAGALPLHEVPRPLHPALVLQPTLLLRPVHLPPSDHWAEEVGG